MPSSAMPLVIAAIACSRTPKWMLRAGEGIRPPRRRARRRRAPSRSAAPPSPRDRPSRRRGRARSSASRSSTARRVLARRRRRRPSQALGEHRAEVVGQPPLARRVPGAPRARRARSRQRLELARRSRARSALLGRAALGAVGAHVVGDEEARLERPAERLLRELHLLGAERLAVGLRACRRGSGCRGRSSCA